ncbi:hypothetical protein HF086_014982 [Spodoptera exigua]|uniref:Peptidase A2 domain-containing protein n=1 Tax=Spodoptera exigua TaxID=7107 RepID=A0A922MKE9_SPOEX|nr:hypothetical protein HF086_014982 [Spodoptera exigua]
MIDDANAQRSTQAAKSVQKPKSFHASVENKPRTKEVECAMCKENHYVYHCKRFGLMTAKERQNFVQNSGLCFNCLAPTHSVNKCRQSLSCRKCGRRHHTLLHFERDNNEATKSMSEVTASSSQQHEKSSTSQGDTRITTTFTRQELQPTRVLLATARVKVFNSNGFSQIIRALIDQGSQASLVTEATVQLLGLTRIPVNGFVSGLGDGHTRIKHRVSLQIQSRYDPVIPVIIA